MACTCEEMYIHVQNSYCVYARQRNTDIGSDTVWGGFGAQSERRHSQPTSEHSAIRQAEC